MEHKNINRKVLIGFGLIALLVILFIAFDGPGKNFSCNNISDEVTIGDQEILVDNLSCTFTLSAPVDGRFSYDDRTDDRPNQSGGEQLILNSNCHESVIEKISPLGASYDPANELFLRHVNGAIYFCRPLVRV